MNKLLGRVTSLMNAITNFEAKIDSDALKFEALFNAGSNHIMSDVVNYERHLLESMHGFDQEDLKKKEEPAVYFTKDNENLNDIMNKINDAKKLRYEQGKLEREEKLKQKQQNDLLKKAQMKTDESKELTEEEKQKLTVEEEKMKLQQKINDLMKLQNEVQAARSKLPASWSNILTPTKPTLGVKVGDVPDLPENSVQSIKEQLKEKTSGHLSTYSEHFNLKAKNLPSNKLV